MNKNNRLVKIFILYFLTQFSCLHSSIQENIIAKVEGEIISSYELKNKIKTILFLSNQQLNQNSINLSNLVIEDYFDRIKILNNNYTKGLWFLKEFGPSFR